MTTHNSSFLWLVNCRFFQLFCHKFLNPDVTFQNSEQSLLLTGFLVFKTLHVAFISLEKSCICRIIGSHNPFIIQIVQKHNFRSPINKIRSFYHSISNYSHLILLFKYDTAFFIVYVCRGNSTVETFN